jgi:DNA polymerase-3 subunit beta
MQKLERVLSQSTAENIEFSIAENQVRIMIGQNTEMVSRLIEGAYPDYQQILPKEFKIKTKGDKNELGNGLKMASLFARESANNINIIFKKDSIDIFAEAAQVGKIDSRVAVKAEGEETKSSFNVKFFTDGLNSINSDVVLIEVSGEVTPLKITDPSAKDFFYILMPLRTE